MDESVLKSGLIVKSGVAIKRSQNKKKWSIVNYKTRWFELSRSDLIYYDNCEGGREVSLLFTSFMISFILIFVNEIGESLWMTDVCITGQPFAGPFSNDSIFCIVFVVATQRLL